MNININQESLLIACRKGHTDIVQYLLENGVSPNFRTEEDGFTLLMEAYYCENFEEMPKIIELLLTHGANPNVPDNDGQSILSFACLDDNLQVIELLLKHNANPHIDDNWLFLIKFLSGHGKLELVQLLLDKRRPWDNINDQLNGDNSTALADACSGGHIDIVRLLLHYGAEVDIQERTGDTALMNACFNGHIEIVRLLLQNGANVNLKGDLGTSLYYACLGGHREIVSLLLDNGANPNIDGKKAHKEIVNMLSL